VSAANSYEKTKGNRDYKEYYAKNRDRKLASGKKYYEENKEKVTDTQKQYHQSKKGRKVMQKAHAKRRKLMAEHKGIPYKREYVIERDKLGGEFPVCYICGEPIKYEREIQLDHLIGITIGGQDCFTNVACTHMVCNLKKTKACTETTVEQVEDIIARAETYIDEHPELFAE
jgi:5-methylcytosine-specific restriction endonuclease McrA